jgi:hypothetical protein
MDQAPIRHVTGTPAIEEVPNPIIGGSHGA